MKNDDIGGVNTDEGLVKIQGSLGGINYSDLTVKEVVLNESLLNPGLQTAVRFQSFIYADGPRDFDQLKNKVLSMTLSSSLGGRNLTVSQKIYRLDNREFTPLNVGMTEEFTVHACDQSLLNDAKSLVSKSWKCATPDSIVKYALQSCAGAGTIDIDSAQPSRDYVAENIHPFQVVAQQANVALDGDDPSFLHYMTYRNNGTHHFKSLRKLCSGSVPQQNIFYQFETGTTGSAVPQQQNGTMRGDYNVNLNGALMFQFPCDFDLLSDLLNGVDENGQNINTVTTMNPQNMLSELIGGGSTGGCGIGSGNPKQSITDKGTNKTGCETDVEKHLLKRQARMGLLEKDKIALRMTTPWRPDIHVGDLIQLNWQNKNPQKSGQPVYGSGTYLVLHLMHKIQFGGYAVTTFDCVAQTAGGGIV